MVDGDFFDEALTARCHVKRLFEHTFFCAMAPSLRDRILRRQLDDWCRGTGGQSHVSRSSGAGGW